METPGASEARARASERANARTRWSYGEECLSWKAYDGNRGLRYTRETLDAVRFFVRAGRDARGGGDAATDGRARWGR